MQPASPGETARAERRKTMSKTITEWVAEVHGLARSKGWWTPYDEGALRTLSADQVLSKLMLVTTELAEAAEEVRLPNFDPHAIKEGVASKPEGFTVELADAVIRLLDLAGAMGLDLEAAIREKHAYNATRPTRHGGKRA